MSGINDKAFKQGKVKMRALLDRYVNMSVNALSMKILKHIQDNAEYFNVTGNTMGSLSCGVYKDGELIYVDQPFSDKIKEQTLKKGEKRKFGNKVYVAETGDSKYFADDAAVDLLQSIKPSSKGFAVVFCVGTEYATYLENTKKLNVMTDTFNHVASSRVGILQRELKFAINKVSDNLPFPMPDSFSAPF